MAETKLLLLKDDMFLYVEDWKWSRNKTFRIHKHISQGCWIENQYIRIMSPPGMVAHACNPSTLGGQDKQITWGQEFETSLGNLVRPYLYKKIKKISLA